MGESNKVKREKPVKKGYEINISYLQSLDEYTKSQFDRTLVAENEKEARKEALTMLYDFGIEENYLGDPLSYINVRVKRCPEIDQFMVGEKLKTRHQIEYDKARLDRDDSFIQMLKDNPGAYAFIRKGGYYYQPNCSGYTEFESYAGVYTLEFAVKQCLGMSLSDYMRPIIIDTGKHNAMLNKQIEGLKSRLITI